MAIEVGPNTDLAKRVRGFLHAMGVNPARVSDEFTVRNTSAGVWLDVSIFADDLFDAEPAHEPTIVSEEKLRAARWLKDRDGDFWEMTRGRYYLNGYRASDQVSRGFEDLERNFGPLIIAEDPA